MSNTRWPLPQSDSEQQPLPQIITPPAAPTTWTGSTSLTATVGIVTTGSRTRFGAASVTATVARTTAATRTTFGKSGAGALTVAESSTLSSVNLGDGLILLPGVGLFANTLTSPGKTYRWESPDSSLASPTVVTYTNTSGSQGTSVGFCYDATTGFIYQCFNAYSDSGFWKIKVEKITPSTMAHSTLITDSIYSDEVNPPGQSQICTDGTHLYLLTHTNISTGPDCEVRKYLLSTGAFVSQRTITGYNHGHAIGVESGVLYGGGTDAGTIPWAFSMPVDLSTHTAVDLSASVGVVVDDIVFRGDYFWLGDESTDRVWRVKKSDLTFDEIAITCTGHVDGLWNDTDLILVGIRDAGTSSTEIQRVDPVGLTVVDKIAVPVMAKLNELIRTGDTLYLATYETDSKVARMSVVYTSLETVGVTTSGTVTPGIQTYFGATSLTVNVAVATVGKLTARGATTTPEVVSVITAGSRQTTGVTESSLTVARTTVGTRTTFGATGDGYGDVFGDGYGDGVLETVTVTTSGTTLGIHFGASSLTLTVSRTTVGKLTARATSATSLTVTAETVGRLGARGAASVTENVTVTVAAKRATFAQVSATETVTATTAGTRKTFGAVARDEVVTVTTNGAPTTGGATSLTLTVAIATVGKLTARGVVSRTETVTAATTARLGAYGAVSRTETVTAATTAHLGAYGAATLTETVGVTTAASKTTYGVVSRPELVTVTTDGVAADAVYSSTSTTLTVTVTTNGHSVIHYDGGSIDFPDTGYLISRGTGRIERAKAGSVT